MICIFQKLCFEWYRQRLLGSNFFRLGRSDSEGNLHFQSKSEDYAKSTQIQTNLLQLRQKNDADLFAAIFRGSRLIARRSKYDFWILREILDRHS